MPIHSRPVSVKHELTLLDEFMQKCPILRDVMAAAQVL